jgi:putative adhesin
MTNKLTKTKFALTLFFSLLTPCLLATAASEEKLSREFDVKPGGKLIVDVDFGNVNVTAGPDGKATIEASRTIDFDDEAAEKAYFSSVPLTIAAEGNSVIVRARSDRELRHQHMHHTRMDARYTIRIPRNFAAELSTGGGSIMATELAGDLHATSGGGDLKLSHLQSALIAKSGGGSIDLTGCSGSSDIQTGGGDIVLSDGQGSLHARTGGGAIKVAGFVGDVDVSTGGGELTLEKIDGALLGKTSGGGISASVTATSIKRIRLTSSGGSIELALPGSAAVDVEARTSAGRIKTNLPLQLTRADDEHLEGKLNGGGSPVVLRTSGGDITVNSTSSNTARR